MARRRATLGIAGVLGTTVVVAAALFLRPGLAPEPAAPSPPTESAAVAANPTSPPSEPSADPTAQPTIELVPEGSPGATHPEVTFQPLPIPEGRIATRVVVPALGIDLAVTRQTTTYPACGVAMYLLELRQPGLGGVTYLYAHAQSGNFLPIYQAALVNDGARMVGMAVEVYTGDSLKFTYRIIEVRRHVTTLDGAFAWEGESIFLQTSEGPGASTPKLQVVGELVSMSQATFEASHPQPHPVVCR